MKVALVQYKFIPNSIQKNLAKIDRVVKKVLKENKNIELIIFPEYALLGGYPYGKTRKSAITKNSPIVSKLKNLAKLRKINIIPGSFILKENNETPRAKARGFLSPITIVDQLHPRTKVRGFKFGDNKYYNSTCFVDWNGEILHWYYKNHLWADEKRVLSNDNTDKLEFVAFNNNLVAIQICADLNSPSLSSKYSKDINMIINISLWSHEDSYIYKKYVPKNIETNIVQTLTRARAIENRCYFLYVNYADKQTIRTKSEKVFVTTSIGETMIVDPYGTIVAKTSTNRESILIYELNLKSTNY